MASSTKLTMAERLKIISKAWGKQKGYVFFPWIEGDAEDRTARIQSYHEGRAFKWPDERDTIVAHLEAHTKDDLYWCPSIFEKKIRRADLAQNEQALWADLDARDPRTIDDYPPTIAWETSPDRYQALWIISGGDVMGASWPGNENQRLTYFLGADPSGWDTTQLLRIPGWKNHKPEHRDDEGKSPKGRLLWSNGRRYLPDEFEELPKVDGVNSGEIVDALEEEVEKVDRHEAWANVRLKLPRTARELVAAKQVDGDRSEKLWWIMRCLADAGVSPVEIVAIVRVTVWNKFDGRQDELKRLLTEASKAVAQRSDDTKERLEREKVATDYPTIVNLIDAVKNYPTPQWLVEGLIADESVGFIAGEPKSFKTWFGLDLALSIATGADFLEHFRVLNPGPVLYLQAEDGPSLIRSRIAKVLPNKVRDKVTLEMVEGQETLVWEPAGEVVDTPAVASPDFDHDELITLSDPGWQAWLDESLAAGYGEAKTPYRAVILDPLMMMAGDVEENRAYEMTNKIYRPLLQLARKHHLAVIVVHHMRKQGEGDKGKRGGQLMLGSVANHAWSQNSLYVLHGQYNTLMMETESKFAQGERYAIKNLKSRSRGKDTWEPQVEPADKDTEQKQAGKGKGDVKKKPQRSSGDDGSGAKRGRPRDLNPPALRALRLLCQDSARFYSTHEVKEKLAELKGVQPTQTVYLQAYQQLKKCWENKQVKRNGKDWMPADVERDEAEELDI